MIRNSRIVFIAVIFIITSLITLAQAPPHPNGGNAPGTGNGPVGGGAPVNEGLSIMLLLGAAYGVAKCFYTQKTSVR
jgi:hypothetical protein